MQQYKIGKKNILANSIVWLTTIEGDLQSFTHSQASQYVSLNNRICKDRAICNIVFVIAEFPQEDTLSLVD